MIILPEDQQVVDAYDRQVVDAYNRMLGCFPDLREPGWSVLFRLQCTDTLRRWAFRNCLSHCPVEAVEAAWGLLLDTMYHFTPRDIVQHIELDTGKFPTSLPAFKVQLAAGLFTHSNIIIPVDCYCDWWIGIANEFAQPIVCVRDLSWQMRRPMEPIVPVTERITVRDFQWSAGSLCTVQVGEHNLTGQVCYNQIKQTYAINAIDHTGRQVALDVTLKLKDSV